MSYEFTKVKLLKVVDGDTMDFEIDLGFRQKTEQRFRLRDIDTPEIYRPHNEAELNHALGAKHYIENLLKSAEGNIKVVSLKNKIGLYGRWDAHVYVGGKSLASYLIEGGWEKLSKEEYDARLSKADDERNG